MINSAGILLYQFVLVLNYRIGTTPEALASTTYIGVALMFGCGIYEYSLSRKLSMLQLGKSTRTGTPDS